MIELLVLFFKMAIMGLAGSPVAIGGAVLSATAILLALLFGGPGTDG